VNPVSDLVPFARHVLAELKRRRVLRVAAAYAAMGFIVAQAADILLPALRLPDWTMTLVVLLLLLGFPFALVLAWFFDISPTGVRRTDDEAPTARDAPPVLHAGGSTQVPEGRPAVPAASPIAPRRPLASRAGGIAAVAGTLILAIAAGAFVLRDDVPDGQAGEVSVAVLPFKNAGGADDGEYISDGLTEAIQTRLNRIEGLRVTSITSVMSYKATSKRMREIAEELGVDHVVEGSVRLAGTRMRISARLIEAATDRTLWSDSFDRTFDDVFDVETEIAERIAAGMRVRLTAAQRNRIGEQGTSSVVAYDLYMKARRLLREGLFDQDWNEERSTFYSAISLLRQALEADPEYAVAWAELSRLYLYHIDMGFAARNDSARVMAERALRYGPQLADGYVAMGNALRWEADSLAARQYERALEREPNHVPALLAAAWLAQGQLRLVDQARLAHRAAQLAPTDPDPLSMLVNIMVQLGDYESAARLYQRLLRVEKDVPSWAVEQGWAQIRAAAGDSAAALRHLNTLVAGAPEGPAVWSTAAGLYAGLKRYDAALPLYEKYVASLGALPDVDGMPPGEKWYAWYGIGYTLMALGDTARGNAYLRDAEQGNLEYRRQRCPNTCRNTALAMLYAFRGDADRAVEFLQYSINVGWVGTYPGSPEVAGWFQNIADDPRYRRIMGDLIADIDRQRDEVRREGLHVL
jgi:adenylate cyclase